MATNTDPVPAPVAPEAPSSPTLRALGEPPKAPSSDAKIDIKMAQDMVNHGVPLDVAIEAVTAIRSGEYADSEAYFAAHPYSPVAATRDLTTYNVPPGPTYGGYLNLQYAYKYLVSIGESSSNADEYVTTMATLAGLTRDARTYIGNGSNPRRLMNVGAARLPA